MAFRFLFNSFLCFSSHCFLPDIGMRTLFDICDYASLALTTRTFLAVAPLRLFPLSSSAVTANDYASRPLATRT